MLGASGLPANHQRSPRVTVTAWSSPHLATLVPHLPPSVRTVKVGEYKGHDGCGRMPTVTANPTPHSPQPT